MGNAILFTSNAADTSTFSWKFGDGDSSTAAKPGHIYKGNKNYSVTLTVNNEGAKPLQNQY